MGEELKAMAILCDEILRKVFKKVIENPQSFKMFLESDQEQNIEDYLNKLVLS